MAQGVFVTDGHEWAEARALLRPSFARTQIYDFDMLERHYQRLLKVLPSDERVSVDLQELFRALSMDIITDMLFGVPTNALTSAPGSEETDFADALRYLTMLAWRDTALGRLATFVPDRIRGEARKIMHGKIDHYVQLALHNREKHLEVGEKSSRQGTFLEHLAERTQDPKVLRDNLLSALFGGRDTTSSLLSNMFHTLARSPKIWCSLREEAMFFKDSHMTQQSMKGATLARQCINESLRLHPVIPINQRWANKNTLLPRGGGIGEEHPVAIPFGCNVYMNVYAMHRRSDIYGEDAEEFKPQRWNDLQPGWAYTPFGGGPRLCIGQEFALMEATYVLLRMAQEFETIEAADDKPWAENLAIALDVASGCKVKLKRVVAE